MKLELKPYEHNDLIPSGKVYTFDMEMTPYEDKRHRTIRVWLPDDYDGKKRFSVIYMHDGQAMFRTPSPRAAMDIDRVAAGLKKDGIDCIVVTIDCSENRGTELTPPFPRGEAGAVVNGFKIPLIEDISTTDQYADFVVSYLKPLIDENLMTLTDPMHTCIGGVSAGGSASFYMMLRNPEVFGRAIVCSPGFPMFSLEKLLDYLDKYDYSKLAGHRVGFYNGDQAIDMTSVDHVLAVYRKLREHGMDRHQNMYLLDTRQSHYALAWLKYFPELIRFLMAEDNDEPQSDPMPPRA